MTAFLAIIRVTVRQTLRFRRALGLLLLSGSTTGMYLVFMLASRSNAGAARRDMGVETAIGMSIGAFINIVVPVVTLIIATSVLGDERRDNTMSFLALRPISRFNIGAAKITAAFLEAFALTGLGAISFGILVGINVGTFSYAAPLLIGTAISTAAYAALFVPLGYMMKRATLIGLTYLFIWENGLAGAIPALATLSPWRIGVSATAALAPREFSRHIPTEFVLGSLQPGAGGALIKALVLSLAAILLVGLILRRRDLAGGSS